MHGQVTPYQEDEVVLVVAPDHPMAGQRVIAVRDLDSLKFVSLQKSSTVQGIRNILEDHGVVWSSLQVVMVRTRTPPNGRKGIHAHGLIQSYESWDNRAETYWFACSGGQLCGGDQKRSGGRAWCSLRVPLSCEEGSGAGPTDGPHRAGRAADAHAALYHGPSSLLQPSCESIHPRDVWCHN